MSAGSIGCTHSYPLATAEMTVYSRILMDANGAIRLAMFPSPISRYLSLPSVVRYSNRPHLQHPSVLALWIFLAAFA